MEIAKSLLGSILTSADGSLYFLRIHLLGERIQSLLSNEIMGDPGVRDLLSLFKNTIDTLITTTTTPTDKILTIMEKHFSLIKVDSINKETVEKVRGEIHAAIDSITLPPGHRSYSMGRTDK